VESEPAQGSTFYFSIPEKGTTPHEHSSDSRPIEISWLEDSPTDALLTKRALAPQQAHQPLHVVEDGVKAMHSCAGKSRTAPRAAAPGAHPRRPQHAAQRRARSAPLSPNSGR